MLPASNRGSGATICAPDVCLTPPPLPYVNVARHSMAVMFAKSVFISMMNALTLRSMFQKTTGDEKGRFGPGPAEAGRFTKGNELVRVEGQPAINLTSQGTGNNANASGSVRIPSGATVFYSFAGSGAGHPASAGDFAALRSALDEAPPPRGSAIEGGSLCLHIAAFTADLPTRVYNAVQRAINEGQTALILDLRGNPGGELTAALRLAEDFLPEGAILARLVEPDGDETIHRSRRERPYSMPLAVLTSKTTASAAELFTGCLKAHGRALVVGEATYGKSTVQRLVNGLDGISTYYATVARWALPGGESIEGGIRPDIEVDPDDAPAAACAALTGRSRSRDPR